MRYLYLDNFRGFADTIVPVADVNFFVGENSTGKTSILRILSLISSPDFWFKQSFDTDILKFGHFDDIVSVHAKNRNYFCIGFIEKLVESEAITPQNEGLFKGFLATYKEHEGIPSISQFTFTSKKMLHTLKFEKSRVTYKSKTVSAKLSSTKSAKKVFDEWVREHRLGRSGYRKLPIPKNFPTNINMDLVLALSFLRHQSTKKQSKSGGSEFSFSFYQPGYLKPIVWIAPIRTQARRTYDEVNLDYSPEGTHTPYVIRKILDSKKEATEFRSFMRRVGKSSGLFETINIKRYGKGVTAPFEVDIVLDKKALIISNVGYGVSQSLPVLVELQIRPEGTWFAIQQPEVHLHPRAQAALGDVFFDLAAREAKCFLIETHSDYAIDRFRMNFRNGKNRHPPSQILFFERKNAQNLVWSISIGEKGELGRKQPASYRRFFMKEQLRALGI